MATAFEIIKVAVGDEEYTVSIGDEAYPALIGPQGEPGEAGGVVGPSVSVDNRIVLFNGTTGNLIKQSAHDETDLDNFLAHLTDTTNPHSVTAAQAGADPTGTAAGLMSTHEATYDHADIALNTTHRNTVTGNPHAVTKSDVGLGNVLNAAQLAIANDLSDLNDAPTARSNLGLGSMAIINDAPSDGKTYGRKDGAWEEIEASEIANAIHAATGKTTPVSADELALVDSEASWGLKKLTWGNLQSTLETYFDTQYDAINTASGLMTAHLAAYAHGDITLNTSHRNTTSGNPHSVTKSDVGLGNVTNDAQLKIASDLADLNDAATARTNLGLGGMAVLNDAPSDGTTYGRKDAAWVSMVTSVVWGAITGTLSNQTDLQNALDAKLTAASNLSDVASAATARTNLGLGTLAVIDDAPSDGNVYGRKDGAWEAVDEAEVAAAINAASAKTTPVDADRFGITDSAASYALKQLTWANLLVGVKAETDIASAISLKHTQGTDLGLDTGGSNPITAATIKGHVETTSGNPHNVTKSDVGLGNVTNDAQVTSVTASGALNSSGGTTPDISLDNVNTRYTLGNTTAFPAPPSAIAFSTLVEQAIGHASAKTTPVDGDSIGLVDSEDLAQLKEVTWANVKATLKTYFDTVYQGTGLALLIANNLSDLNDVPTARSNLGLGSAAVGDAQSATLTAPLTSTQAFSVIGSAAPTISMPAATNANDGYATSSHIQAIEANTSAISALGTMSTVNDAPSDGSFYGRLNAAWADSTNITAVGTLTSLTVSGDVTLSGAASQLFLPQVNDATNPTIAFGDGNTGFYEDADNQLCVAIGGVKKWTFYASVAQCEVVAGSPRLNTTNTPSATVPTYQFYSDADTGIGRAGANQLSLIAGGVENLRLTTTTIEGLLLTADANNVRLGANAGNDSMTSVRTVVIGVGAGESLTDGDNNVAIGDEALGDATSGYNNIAIGREALEVLITNANNVGIGYQAGKYVTGNTNVAVGTLALAGSAGHSSTNNVAVGDRALSSANGCYYNVAVGAYAGFGITTARHAIVIGEYAGKHETTNFGRLHIDAYGDDRSDLADSEANAIIYGVMTAAGKTTQTLSLNAQVTIARGLTVNNDAAAVNFVVNRVTTGTAFEYNGTTDSIEGDFITANTDNTLLGVSAGGSITSGVNNTLIGEEAGSNITDTSNNTCVGYQAGNGSGVAQITAFGKGAGRQCTGLLGTFVGMNAGTQTTGQDYVVYVGEECGVNMRGDRNTVVGASALYGSGTPASNTGSYNTVMGWEAMGGAVTTASYNTVIGYNAGNASTAIDRGIFLGAYAGKYETVGGKLFIDSYDRSTEAGARSNSIIYGIMAVGGATSQQLFLNAETYINTSVNFHCNSFSTYGAVAGIGFNNPILVDDIDENTLDHGVEVEGLVIKDSGFALGSDADGDIYYRGSGALARLAKGTGYQHLRMNSGATAPEWASLPPGTVYVDVGAMVPASTEGATATQVETATYKHYYDVMSFDGGASDTHCDFKLRMPEDWDGGTIKVKALWEPAAGASADDWIRLDVQAVALGNDDAIDAAFGTAVYLDDQVIAVGDLHDTGASAALTVAGSPAAGDVIHFLIGRDADYDGGGGTAMAEALLLHSIEIQYTKTNTPPSAW